MENIGTVVGILAMVVALAGVFYSSVAMKKVDENNEMFIRAKVAPVAEELREVKTNVATLKKDIEKLAADLEGFKPMREEIETALNQIERRLSAVAASLK